MATRIFIITIFFLSDLLLPVEDVKQVVDYVKLENMINKLDSDNDLCYAIQKAYIDLCYTLTQERTLY